MNKYSAKLTALALAVALGGAALPWNLSHAAAAAGVSPQEIQQAANELAGLRVIQGYEDGSMNLEDRITRAELAKMVALTFGLQGKADAQAGFADVNRGAWYFDYAAELAARDIMPVKGSGFQPKETVTSSELAQIVAKALNRDLKSVDYWLSGSDSVAADTPVTRGEAAYLLNTARQAIPSSEAKITSVRSLNAITLIVTFDAPLAPEDEAFVKAKADFAFNDGLTLTNMPRLKTGSIATYIVPTSVQQQGTTYTLTYKGGQAGTFEGNASKLAMTEARQIANDTFELEALKSNGVVDYGYVISAYSAGRGANAFVLDENNRADGRTYQIISSGQGREVTITPEGGQPITAKYVPFTQSTDGKQEPKFRLPEGEVLKPGVKYTVTSDWADIEAASFVAKEIAPLEIAGAEAVNETSINIALSEDPGDEMFSGRRVELTDAQGNKLSASYKYSSRKGAVGVFDLEQGGTLEKGAKYTVTPVGDWAGSSKAELAVN